MTSWSSAAIHLYIKHIRRPKAVFGSAKTTAASIEQYYLNPQSFAPPTTLGADITISRVDLTSWPLYRVSSFTSDTAQDPAQPPRRALLYLHGGAFFREIDPFHWKFIAQLARETKLDVLVAIYPLLPRPIATAEQVVQGLVDICRLSKQDVVSIAGDSAGGTLALATAQQLVAIAPDVAKKLTSVVLISPSLDCAFDHPEVIRLEAHDPWLAIEGLREVVAPKWRGDLSITDPRVSPLFGEIEGLPPVLLLAGTADLLCADARRLSAKFQKKGNEECAVGSVEVEGFTYVEFPDMIHVYPILPHWEGAQARVQITSFISKHLEEK